MHSHCHSRSKGPIQKIEKLFNRNELWARTRGQSKVPAFLESRAISLMMFTSIVHRTVGLPAKLDSYSIFWW